MTTIITSMLSAAGGAIFAYLYSQLKKSQAQNKVIKSLAHDRLFSEAKRLISQGYTTVEELENLEYLWTGYSGMGLNGTGEALYNKCKNLDIRG